MRKENLCAAQALLLIGFGKLAIAVNYTVETIFQAVGGARLYPAKNVIRAGVDWNAACFLVPGIPLAAFYLRDSLKVYRRSFDKKDKPFNQLNSVNLARLSSSTYPIPLRTSGIGGVQVSRAQQVQVEEESASEKDLEKFPTWRLS